MELRSQRLVLRPWEDRHRQPFADMSADPAVMGYMMPLTPHAAHTTWIDNQRNRVGYDAPFTGWRMARPFWGRGYAPEAAATCLRFGFEGLDLPEIVANTVSANLRSRRVMEKLGMVHDPRDDFDHPRVPRGHPLRRQVLYRLTRERWLAQNAA
ncbi:GNAT family N-acetyltransferase [Novacetimonas maltaceti]|uniref:N-acetyltransferase domain-containing protein n=1 Tax=Novacetimonas maltaceti TaxID=1203393 RepID=A0A2S3VYK8_9PROT|nr:GNAT family N-acetyltransferase [Novacetimonas maltaceti]POF61688.1 hypothetical protein KMAL_26980 [Novacetimonas maltaceti]PYD60979.1 GNAT family N-acetyltransferase [Novacetimonas maltaceti]